MQTLKTLWYTIKAVLWFTWRHAILLSAIWFVLDLIVDNWTLSFTGIAKLFLIATVIDWIKMKFKFQSCGSYRHSSDAPQPLHVQQYWNSSVVGSPSYLSSIGSSSYNH